MILLKGAVTALAFHLTTQAAESELALGVRTTEPRTPADQRSQFQLPPGFEIQLVAAEPDIHKPMNLAFDAIGRLWATTSIEYPWPAPTNRIGRDRLMIFEDFGTDGRARKVTQFAEGLNIPIGVYPFRTDDRHWKAIVWSIPNIWLLEDTDGDGKADKRTALYGPFDHTRDTHGNQASFRRGFDGWLYATHGFNNDSHVTARDGSHVDLNSGNTYRIQLDGSHIEHHTHGQVNPFGLAWDVRGNLYSSDCHSAPLYQLLTGGWYPSFGKPDDGLGFAPVMLEHAHGSTAIDGAIYYNDTLWPAEYQDTLFIGNVMTSRLNRDKIQFLGSTPKAVEQPDFLTSSDPWFRPVDNLLGPDGALYIADFYNRIIGHYEVPLTHPGRDRERGRIWRVVYNGSGTTAHLRPATLPSNLKGLIKELQSPNLNRQLLAMGEIQDRFGKTAIPALREALTDSRTRSTAETQDPIGGASALQANTLWLLHRLGALDHDSDCTELRFALLEPESSRVRIHALRIITERGMLRHETSDSKWNWAPGKTTRSLLKQQVLSTSSGLAARCAAEALGAWPDFDQVRALLEALSRVNPADTHLVYVLRKALRDHLRLGPIFDDVLSRSDWSDSELRTLANVCLAIPTSQSASFLLRQFPQLSASTFPSDNAALQHIARYLPEGELPKLAQLVQERFATQRDFQLSLFRSIDQGLQQRGLSLPASLKQWGTRLVGDLIQDGAASSWINRSLDPATENPWDFQERSSSDGRTLRVLSSLTHGEQKTGVLQSPHFAAGSEFSFWLCGHDGYPDKPAKGVNQVRLRDAQTQTVLFEAAPPRNDVAQRVLWNTRSLKGRQVFLEVADGDTGDAYAWLAIGDIHGGPELPSTSPRGRSDLLLAAAELAGRLGVSPESSDYTRLMPLWDIMRNPKEDLKLRSAALRVMQPNFRSEADLLGDNQIPAIWRQRAADALTSGSKEARQNFLTTLWKEAPQRVQIRFAKIQSSSVHGAKELAQGIERGEIPSSLLRDKTLLEALLLKADPDVRMSLKKTAAAMPQGDDSRSMLITERRESYNRKPGEAKAGAKLFQQHCSPCHQIEGKGGLVGPQLTGIGNRGVERLCEDILNPNQNVDRAFRQSLINLKNGENTSGLFRRQDGDLLVFADATGKEFAVRKGEIEQRVESEQSLMPENFGESLSPDDFNHLLSYLLIQR